MPTILDSVFTGVANTTSTPTGWEGVGRQVATKWQARLHLHYSQMASIGAIFTSTYYTKQLYPGPNSPATGVVNYSWLSACQGDMEPFEGDPSTRGHLTSFRNKTQQKQPG